MPTIHLNNYQKGQTSSPYINNGAFSRAQNLDVFSQPGMARINYLPVAYDTDTDSLADIPVSVARQESILTNVFIGSQDNKVYLYNTSTTKITDRGTGGKFVTDWKGYLLGAGTGVGDIKYWTTPTTWANLADGSSLGVGEHFLFKSSQDDKLYICNGQKIAVVDEDTDFDPSNAATHSFTAAAFTLPEGYLSYSITDLNDRLVISAVRSTSSATPEKVSETAYFIWDRAATSSDQIFFIPESDMTTMMNIGNIIYITGGENGRVYTLSESGLKFLAQIPFDLDNNKKVKIGRFGHQSLAWFNNHLLVGVSSDDGLYPAGIYGITPDGRICHEFLPSEGYDGSTKDVRIGPIFTIDENNIVFGWENNTDSTYGFDKIQTSGNRQISYSSYFESILHRVGTQHKLAQFEDIDVQLIRPLQTGEGVRLKFRENTNDSWTTLTTRDGNEFTYAQYGAITQFTMPFGKRDIQNIQFRIDLTTGASSKNTPYLFDITIPYAYN